jgi:hypothetical protein
MNANMYFLFIDQHLANKQRFNGRGWSVETP